MNKIPNLATPVAPKVTYDEQGRLMVETKLFGKPVLQLVDTNEPAVRAALLAMGWNPPGYGMHAAYESVAAIIGAGGTFQEVVDFLMHKLGVQGAQEVKRSDVLKNNAREEMNKEFGPYFLAIVKATTPEEEQAACRALAIAVNADLDKAISEETGIN